MTLKKIYSKGDYIDFKHDAREWKITKVGIKWLHLRNDDLGLVTKVLGTDTHYSHRKNKEDIAVKHHEEKLKMKMFNAMKHFKNEKEEEEVPEDESKAEESEEDTGFDHEVEDLSFKALRRLWLIYSYDKRHKNPINDKLKRAVIRYLTIVKDRGEMPAELEHIKKRKEKKEEKENEESDDEDDGYGRKYSLKKINKFLNNNHSNLRKYYPIYIQNSDIKYKYIKRKGFTYYLLNTDDNSKKMVMIWNIDYDKTINK